MPHVNPYETALAMLVRAHEKNAENAENAERLFVARATVEGTLPVFLHFYEKELNDINPATFRFLSLEQRQARIDQLKRIHFLLQAQHRFYRNKSLNDAIWVCDYYIFLLTQSNAEELDAGESPVKYLGLGAAHDLAAQVDDIADGKVESAISFLRGTNVKRSYWRYCGGIVNHALTLLSQNDARRLLERTNIPTGYLSWTLYYVLFGLNLYLMLKHSIAGPWMSQEEKAIPGFVRFKTQWQQRKFALMNDFVWATVNLIGFFWLVGSGTLGYSGNLVSVHFLVFDVLLVLWHQAEEKTKYNQKIDALDAQILSLDQAAKSRERDELIRMKHQIQREFEYKQAKISYSLVYCIGVFTSFLLICSLLCPPLILPATTAFILAMVGTAIGFAVNMWCQFAGDKLQARKTKHTIEDNQLKRVDLIDQLTESGVKITRLQAQHKRLEANSLPNLEEEKAKINLAIAQEENVRKLLYLQIGDLDAETEHQKKMLGFQHKQLILSILSGILIPTIVFLSLAFLPAGLGIGVLAAGLVLLFLAKKILNHYAPNADDALTFDTMNYEAFLARNGQARLVVPMSTPSTPTSTQPSSESSSHTSDDEEPGDDFSADLMNH